MPKRSQKAHEATAGEIGEAAIQERGNLGLVNAHEFGGTHLGQSPALQNPADVAGKLSLGQFLFRLGESKIRKHVAATFNDPGLSHSCETFRHV
jgi:hypothetical protein